MPGIISILIIIIVVVGGVVVNALSQFSPFFFWVCTQVRLTTCCTARTTNNVLLSDVLFHLKHYTVYPVLVSAACGSLMLRPNSNSPLSQSTILKSFYIFNSIFCLFFLLLYTLCFHFLVSRCMENCLRIPPDRRTRLSYHCFAINFANVRALCVPECASSNRHQPSV